MCVCVSVSVCVCVRVCMVCACVVACSCAKLNIQDHDSCLLLPVSLGCDCLQGFQLCHSLGGGIGLRSCHPQFQGLY